MKTAPAEKTEYTTTKATDSTRPRDCNLYSIGLDSRNDIFFAIHLSSSHRLIEYIDMLFRSRQLFVRLICDSIVKVCVRILHYDNIFVNYCRMIIRDSIH